MPQILIYEFVSSGGLLASCGTPASESLRREGAAMMSGLAADFAALPDVETLAMLDSRAKIALPGCHILPIATAGEEFAVLSQASCAADWTIVIAPEFDDLLRSRCQLVEESGGRLLGASSMLASLAGDKQRMAEHLAAVGVPVPRGIAIGQNDSLPAGVPFPAVFKPRFGAGSQDVRLIADELAAKEYLSRLAGSARLEAFCPGTAASVAFLCGPAGCFALPPCRQRLSDDGEFRYLGGELPLEPALAERGAALARRAVTTLPNPLGYLGVDLVLGSDSAGQGDVVIEINPRLSTSYVGLRAVSLGNLAAAMLDVAAGKSPRLSFGRQRLEFDADGTLRAYPKTVGDCHLL